MSWLTPHRLLECTTIAALRWCWCWLNIWNGIVFALDKQKVRWYWCMIEFECTNARAMTQFQFHTRLLFNYNAYDTALLGCWFNIWNGIVLTLDEQGVCWYWCMFEFECVISWCMMHHDTLTRLLFKYTTMTMTSASAPMLIFFEYKKRYRSGFGWTARTLVFVHVCIPIYHCMVHGALYTTMTWNMVLRWFWLNKCNGVMSALDEQNVGIGVCFNLTISSLGIPYTIAIAYILVCYSTTMTMIYGSALMLNAYMERYCVGCQRTGSTLALVHDWIWICHYFVYDAACHIYNCTHAYYSTAMEMKWNVALRWYWC